jgi:hypothetical protein
MFVAVVPVSAQSRASRNKPLMDMITALGGDAFLNAREIHTTGRFFSFQRGELTGGDIFVDYIKLPDMERTEFGREKTKSVQINKGEEGWTVEGKNGEEVEPLSRVQIDEFVANFKTSFDYVTRYVLEHPATTIQDLGSQIIDFKRVDVIELRDSAKNLIRFYIDRETHLPLKMQVRLASESGMREEVFANWHKFNGITTPLFVGRFKDGVKMMEIRLETAAYNTGLADNLFVPPASK